VGSKPVVCRWNPSNLLPMSLTCVDANNLSSWVYFLWFRRKPEGQYDEEALIGWKFSCIFSCDENTQIEWPMGSDIGKYDEKHWLVFKPNFIFQFTLNPIIFVALVQNLQNDHYAHCFIKWFSTTKSIARCPLFWKARCGHKTKQNKHTHILIYRCAYHRNE